LNSLLNDPEVVVVIITSGIYRMIENVINKINQNSTLIIPLPTNPADKTATSEMFLSGIENFLNADDFK